MAFPTSERIDLIRLSRCEGIGPVNFRLMMARYNRAAAALSALPDRMRLAGRTAPPRIPTCAEVEKEIEATERLGGRIIVLGDIDYPVLLSHINDSPPVISIMGNSALLSTPSVGIVGARNASAAGIRMAEALSAELAAANLCVVSGLARGIDAAAHRAALHPGLTVAAIAGGLDQVYPPEHASLQAEIASNGCLVTEAPLGTVPQSRHFPRRNRLIAGLSLGCVIVEAALRSGTLITARLALQYGREIFAVPGSPLDPRSRGCNDLLRNGATLTETVADILPHIPSRLPAALPTSWHKTDGFAEGAPSWNGGDGPNNEVIARVRELLSLTPVPVDDVVRRCQFSVSAVMAALSELELGGLATFLPGGQVMLLPEACR